MKKRWNNMNHYHSIANLKVSCLISLLFIIIVSIMACTRDSHKSQQGNNVKASAQDTVKEENISAVKQIDETKSDVINNDDQKSYMSSSDFLNSTEGVRFQAATWRFAKAFFRSNKEEMGKYLKKGTEVIPSEKDIFLDIEYLILKWSLNDMTSDDKIGASYQFHVLGEESDTYLSLSMEKIDGEWKVASYGLEK